MRSDKLVSGLLAHVGTFPPGDRGALLELLQQWLRAHLGSWSGELRDRWGLDEFAEMDLSAYAIEESSLDPDEEFRQLKSVPPLSMDEMAMRIRDILEFPRFRGASDYAASAATWAFNSYSVGLT